MAVHWTAVLRSFWLQHKLSIIDLGVLTGIMGVATYVAFAVDIFANEPGVPEKTLTLELDEIMLLGAVLLAGLLIFAVRRYVAQKRETARRISAEHRARELAYQDPLTGLANRRQFGEALDVALKSPASSEAMHALLLCDLNGFKQVNDIYGHGVGDEVLIVVAQRLMQAVRDTDLVARLGGDEFAVLAQHLMGPEAAAALAQRIIGALEMPIVTGNTRHTVGAGIGIATIEGGDSAEILRRADLALYRAKAERRSAFRFFAEDMDRLAHERDALERDLRAAMAEGAITTVFEPTVDLATGRIVAFEAMPRWVDIAGAEVPALRFLAVAEDTGLIHMLGERMLVAACEAARDWPQDVRLSLDLYPGQLSDAQLSTRILGIVREAGFDPHRLEVEIAESLLVQNPPMLRSTFDALRGAGVRIALDHFGTGYSTLYHLREFAVDRVKIDRSFVAHAGETNDKLLSALAGLGRGLGLEVVADGVAFLGDSLEMIGSGIQQGQGSAFGHALGADAVLTLLSQAVPVMEQRRAS